MFFDKILKRQSNLGGDYLVKYNIWLPIMIFAFFTSKQLIFNDEIQWINNIGLSIFTFLIYSFWEWAKKPYKRNENKQR